MNDYWKKQEKTIKESGHENFRNRFNEIYCHKNDYRLHHSVNEIDIPL